MSYKIPMGPYHPALEGTYKLDLICEGETVWRLQAAHWLQLPRHRASGRNRANYIQVVAADGARCGICSNIHTLTLCQAMEGLTGLTPPPRAKYYSRHHGGSLNGCTRMCFGRA